MATTPAIAQAFGFSQVHVFGDSLVDTGNLLNVTGGLIPPQPFYTNGRFSNGSVWVEYLSPELGLTYDPSSNFAFGGATSGTTNTINNLIPLPGLPGLQQQVNGFTQATSADPHALYILSAGANDYLGGGVTNPATPVNNLKDAISALVADGAKNILISNVPDLGNLPGTRQNQVVAQQLTALSVAHNSLLAQTLGILKPSLDPSVNLVTLDVFSLLNSAIANPTSVGLTNATDSCLSPPPLLNPGTIPAVCSNPDTYLFWDDIHPTTTGHRQVAEFAFSTLNSAAVPEPPATLGLLTFGIFLAGAAALKRRNHRKIRSFSPTGCAATGEESS
ncbi:MAG: SGNH/GDSL hydrolase family protein [Leptolyngbyaceae cyanobacterium RU_5_1]|nr:SGNH/GDSL hydrolase family protein [Leptolyngbyaceae cyanobacterium RU_5_1]